MAISSFPGAKCDYRDYQNPQILSGSTRARLLPERYERPRHPHPAVPEHSGQSWRWWLGPARNPAPKATLWWDQVEKSVCGLWSTGSIAKLWASVPPTQLREGNKGPQQSLNGLLGPQVWGRGTRWGWSRQLRLITACYLDVNRRQRK